MSNWKDAMKNAGFASNEPAKQEPVAITPQPMMQVEVSEKDIETGIIFVEVLGRKRAEELLYEEQTAPYGFGRSQGALRRAVETTLRGKPAREAEPLLSRLSETPLMRCGRARDFNDHLVGVYNAVATGVVERRLAELRSANKAAKEGRLTIPALPALSDEELVLFSRREEVVNTYRQAVQEWRGGLTIAQLRALGNPSEYDLTTKAEEALNKSVEQVQERLINKAISDFDNGGTPEVFVAECKRLEGLQFGLGEKAFYGSSRVWELAEKGYKEPKFGWDVDVAKITSAPDPQWLSTASFETLAKFSLVGAAASVLRPRLIELLPEMTEKEVYSRKVGGAYLVFTRDGMFGKMSCESPEPSAGVYVTEPHPKGWWWKQVRSGMAFNPDTEEWRFATPDLFPKLQFIQQARRGAVDISEVVGAFGRHPERGYPRLLWDITAGRSHASFELPVQMFREDEGELCRRFDALSALRLAGLEKQIPTDAYWVDCRLGTTKAGAPRLDNGRPQSRAVVVVVKTGASSHGRHGWSGNLLTAEKELSRDVTILCSRYNSSFGGGLSQALVVAWVPEGKTLALSNGKGLHFDGEKVAEVAGGGLSDRDNPSLD